MYDKILKIISEGKLSRAKLVTVREHAQQKIAKGDLDAWQVLKAVDAQAVPDLEREYAFIGFCPGGDIKNRQDMDWIAKGQCVFNFVDSTHQLERFHKIMPGDTIILKKREQFGETMILSRHGKVKRVVEPGRVLDVDWCQSDQVIEVPLMGANSTVDIRGIATVEKEMPEQFWSWISS